MLSQQNKDSSNLEVRSVALSAAQPSQSGVLAAPSQRLAALAGVKAAVTVVAGTALTTVGQVLNLKEGEVLRMDSELNSPFDVVLNGNVIARGELVAAGDHFGIRITQVAVVDR